jgi:hypothetical protein
MDVTAFERDERQMPLDYWRQCRNLWCDYCFEAPAFGKFAEFLDTAVAHTLVDHLVYVMCIAPRPGAELSLDMRPRSGNRLFSLGLFYSVLIDDQAGIAMAKAMHQLSLERCLELGGRPYLYGYWGGSNGLSSQLLHATFGAGYQNLLDVRGKVDPLGLLNAGALNCR